MTLASADLVSCRFAQLRSPARTEKCILINGMGALGTMEPIVIISAALYVGHANS